MGLIVAIDSGEFSGWARAEGGRIVDCGLVVVKPDKPLGTLPEITGGLAVIEKPVIRPDANVDPNDMITLGIKVGRFAETYLVLGNRIRTIRPTDWKGSTPKQIQNGRDAQALDPAETAIVARCMSRVAASYQNNVWDAIGIALWAARKEKERGR